MLGTTNGSVADSPRTVTESVKEVLWDNKRQRRFGRKWIDDKSAGCRQYALPFPKREARLPRSQRETYQVGSMPRRTAWNLQQNHPGRVIEQEVSKRWNKDRVRNYGWHEWPQGMQRATHAKARSMWAYGVSGTGKSKSKARTWKEDWRDDRRDSRPYWMYRQVNNE